MVWQRSGTVAVQNGSTTVVGTGLDFAASSRVGDSFIGPDGASYEVSNVASATVISILPAYKGATASGADYAIMPVQGYDKMLSDAFNSLNNQFGPKLAALGTTGNYDVLPAAKGGTGLAALSAFIQAFLATADTAAGRSALVAAKSGANTDITSLGGLTTALSLAQGGTGGTTQATARTGLGLGAAALVDVVGLMTNGAIIESGSNSNGEYTLYQDGTAIVTRTAVLGTVTVTTASGPIFVTSVPSAARAIPITLTALHYWDIRIIASSAQCWVTSAADSTLASWPAFYIHSAASGTPTMTAKFFAKGRWKA
ncbi:MAG: hypothetical protein ACK418_09650 [Pseudomonas sp.]|uniref:hypothetical protein n=1 Tax=Pseudomonas sp. TaxID=306 RepID=UPI00391BCFD9